MLSLLGILRCVIIFSANAASVVVDVIVVGIVVIVAVVGVVIVFVAL